MGPTLVILAAGLGTRFGGEKQLAVIGPGGQPLLAFAIHDAARAGFRRAVLVVREGLEPRLRQLLTSAELPLEFVIQEAGRPRPWGTGHAVLAASALVGEPFMVVNADDFYGAGTYRILAEFLARPAGAEDVPVFALATFPLVETLSAHGAVNRGICRATADGWLVGIEEVRGLEAGAGDWSPATPVSLNCWAFTPAVFPLLRQGFTAFRSGLSPESEEEFMLPEAINTIVAAGLARVQLLPARGPWLGITWPEDAARVTAHLARMAAAGEYPTTW